MINVTFREMFIGFSLKFQWRHEVVVTSISFQGDLHVMKALKLRLENRMACDIKDNEEIFFLKPTQFNVLPIEFHVLSVPLKLSLKYRTTQCLSYEQCRSCGGQ